MAILARDIKGRFPGHTRKGVSVGGKTGPAGKVDSLKKLSLLIVLGLLLVPSLSFGQASQWGFGPISMQPMLRDPELNSRAAGLSEPQRDVPLSGIGGISWGTDVRFLNGLKHVSDADMLGGIAQYVLEKPLTHLEKIPVDKMLFGFWNGMFCNALIDLKDLQRYLTFKDHFTKVFGPPFIEKKSDQEKCSWKAKYAIILMRYDGSKGRITIWSDEVYQKMVAGQQAHAQTGVATR